jgi:threonylcarbamoyladenosine tRNA methylthiotransferase MtaB
MNVYLQTFGCRANQYDTEQVRALLEAGGATVVRDVEAADVAIYNSCAVTHEAVADLRQQVRRGARLTPGLRSVVMGCAAAVDDGAIAALPGVSDVVPGADLAMLAGALALPSTHKPPARQTGARGLLRIQDGCAEHCTFCATTLARGAHRSRPEAEVVAEAAALAEYHSEIVLTGIHIGHWGREIGSSLGKLLQRLVRDVPTVRFRLSSVEATEVDAPLRECFAERRRVAPHLHAPLQSGSDAVLKRMGRHWYTAASYATAIGELVQGETPFALGADVITGFPGETDADHDATLSLVRALPFTYLHVFPWSPRPGTAALSLQRAVPTSVARERAASLRAVAAEKARAYATSRSITMADVVVVRGAGQEGLTEDYLTVRLSGAPRGRGDRLPARLQRLDDDTLLAIPNPS